jgi:hypothetical protein
MKPAVKAALSGICVMYIGAILCGTGRRFGTIWFEVCYSVRHWGGYGKCVTVYGIGEGTGNDKRLKLNGTLGILFCANDDNLLGENKHTLRLGNKRRVLLVTINELTLVANAEVKVGNIHNTEVGKQVL